MANHGVGNSKFVSVNLNKSYGQQQRSSSSRDLGGSRVRSSGGGNGVSGGSGMVVLSRSRSSIVGGAFQKGGPKLSVPPPLNLPSLRKEHEKFDSSTSGSGGSAGSGSTGAGNRPANSSIGWTKPAPSVLQEKDSGNGSGNGSDHPLFERARVGSPRATGIDLSSSSAHSSDRLLKGNSVYMPPSVRSGVIGSSVAGPTNEVFSVHRAVVLRGEDFPSLQATLPVTTGGAQKHKDNLNQKQNQKVGSEASDEQMSNSHLRTPFVMQPQNQSLRLVGNASDGKEGVTHRSGGSRTSEQLRKQDDIFPSPLPLVRLNHRSDWADDERDTGYGFLDRDRDRGHLRNEFFRDRDFDFPKVGMQPRTSVHDFSEGRGLRHDEVGRPPSGGFLRGNTYTRDVRSPSRENRDGGSWRAPSHTKEGFGGRDFGIDRNGVGARPYGGDRVTNNENKYGQSPFRENNWDAFSNGISGNQDSRFGRRDMGSRQTVNHMGESYNGRGVEQTKLDHYGGDLAIRHRGDSYQNGSLPRSSGKGFLVSDPILNVGKEKRVTSGKQYLEEPYLKDFNSVTGFDGTDPFTGTFAGVLKRKKDVLKQAEFHDPVRDSFEAELERVQKLQEQERQRVIDEQERALELARKEEEERERISREEEERRRRVEEEAREAAWRAEHERLEAVRRAEEQKTAREEEKRRLLMEEERRKEAARQKLLELEARIARRQAEGPKENDFSSAVRDERVSGVFQEKDVPRVSDVVDWEDGERMVERITSSASSDSSIMNRSLEINSRPQFYRDGDSAFLDRGNPSNSWRRDLYDNGNNSSLIWQDQENGYRSPRRDPFSAGRAFGRKEFYGGPSAIPAKTSSRGGIPEPPMVDEFPHSRGNRWNLTGDGDHFNRNSDADPEFHDVGWGISRLRGNHPSSYPERLYQNSDSDGFSSFVKSRHSMRQPRVLPPPSLASMHKNTFRAPIEPHSSSVFRDSEPSYHHAPRRSDPILQTRYEASYQEELDHSRMADYQKEDTISQDQNGAKDATPRCDSQSSLSVSSPPTSPTHLSHDDLEDSGESPSLQIAAEGEEVCLIDNEGATSVAEVCTTGKVMATSSISNLEDEEWEIENHRDLAEQEEYEEEENGYRDEDEVLEGDDENVGLPQEFEDLHLDEKDSSSRRSQLVFGFDESVDVVMPSGDDSERIFKNEERKIGIQQISSGDLEEVGRLDEVVGIGENLQTESSSSRVILETSKLVLETEKAVSDVGLQLVDADHSSAASAACLHDSSEAPSISSTPPQQPVASSVDTAIPSLTTQPAMSTISAVSKQPDVPVKLQFGLFSGPPLIPSPIPAIQIGSIQMPLHLHPQVGQSLTQLRPPQAPFFQFGQLRYPSPVSQGILPLGPPSMSYVQPSVPASYSFNQNKEGSLNRQEGQDLCVQKHFANDNLQANSVGNQSGVEKLVDQSREDPCKKVDVLSVRQAAENEVMVSHSQANSLLLGQRKLRPEPTVEVNSGYQYLDGKKNYRSIVNNRPMQNQLQAEQTQAQFLSKAPGPMSSSRGKRYVYTVKNSGSRSSLPVSDYPHTEYRGLQRRARQKVHRTEFRVRENVDKRQREALLPSNCTEPEEKSSFSGRISGTSMLSVGKEAFGNKTSKQIVEAESLNTDAVSAHDVDIGSKLQKQPDKELPAKELTFVYNSCSNEGNSDRNNSFDEDVDALQSGIVRIFKQPGIEAPSDEDDFIEVRSKRQMLNDRREQREKEIRANARVVKAPKKRRSVSQNNVSTISNKSSAPLGGEASQRTHYKSVIRDGRTFERPTGFTNNSNASLPLAPIGTPVYKDSQADIRPYNTKYAQSPQSGSIPVISSNGTNLVPSLPFENIKVVSDSVPTSLGPWGSARGNQQSRPHGTISKALAYFLQQSPTVYQVMALTQTQLDEAMKPTRLDKHVASIGDRNSAVIEPNKLSSSIVTKDKPFSSSASPLNSLLAGEKIQFGAVTSPTILPPSSLVSNGMGPKGSCRSDLPVEHNLSAIENECSLFFGKDKHVNESCVDLEDSEAEAEAAASAVAVAAISSDEIVCSGCSVSVADTKSFGVAENEGLASEGGVISDRQLPSQSRVEESLTVALPADLSVDTPSLSLWPSLPSPQHTCGQMLSHFSGGPPTHFPCYEMNPMLGGPIFAFGPHDEAAGTQSQSEKGNASGSGPLGAWQQCHSGVDSFYGPHAGFTGPFISPSGGIPGVQGPPHMVVYNHFTPVGQFGQVGLSFMGATYIPSGKQPDWKHNPASSGMGMGEGEINNMNLPSVQHNSSNMPTPIQHLAPGSPLLPLASPLAMFDMSPFQSSGELPVQARWSHFSATPLHSAPLSMPSQQHADAVLPAQFSHGSTNDRSSGNRFQEPCSSATTDNGRNFSVEAAATVSQFPDELGLMDTSSTSSGTRVSASRPISYSSTITNGKAQSVVTQNSSRSPGQSAGDSSSNYNSSSNNSNQSNNSSFKTHSTQQQTASAQQYLHSSGYNDHRGVGVSQKVGSGGEWPHRRMGFQGRNQSSGTDKKGASKVKQIYVAKPATRQTSPGV
ncbi:hypothetical protein IFM89_001981 [Coptis chinensis]|uniref:Uncharacterized protein n=1 Tax=Coptis chinensis TaxID=261450 RepID=A0A835HJ42_9MAGN|nr:hypothetical protein IFM89_001981 [Coptis chinensis]